MRIALITLAYAGCAISTSTAFSRKCIHFPGQGMRLRTAFAVQTRKDLFDIQRRSVAARDRGSRKSIDILYSSCGDGDGVHETVPGQKGTLSFGNGSILDRREAIVTSACAFLLFAAPKLSSAVTGQVKTSQYPGPRVSSGPLPSPKDAFKMLLASKKELEAARKLVGKKNSNAVESLRGYVADGGFSNLEQFEASSKSILRSGKLTDEDKKAIGTIRTYGAGADVMIMYGGLLAEISDDNENVSIGEVNKFLSKAFESLNEVIGICENSDF
eukprot:CAMPEP_0194267602 /NCGR_PEP_ID=MMETSP0169-20130528/2078_1 /TAXON_ID=218684 /ORGANISM="Corethron pennatum, Strain L29A3" /LENGTH=271 /DNA_ID=CAMNT_0039008499 /DNA_START=25 /DNA_END=840 /DNA_ORIENTATION=-